LGRIVPKVYVPPAEWGKQYAEGVTGKGAHWERRAKGRADVYTKQVTVTGSAYIECGKEATELGLTGFAKMQHVASCMAGKFSSEKS